MKALRCVKNFVGFSFRFSRGLKSPGTHARGRAEATMSPADARSRECDFFTYQKFFVDCNRCAYEPPGKHFN